MKAEERLGANSGRRTDPLHPTGGEGEDLIVIKISAVSHWTQRQEFKGNGAESRQHLRMMYDSYMESGLDSRFAWF